MSHCSTKRVIHCGWGPALTRPPFFFSLALIDSSLLYEMNDPNVDDSSSRTRPFPSEITARLNPATSFRLLVTLSFPLLILLALPFWWYTTSIERLPLPTARISALEVSSVRLHDSAVPLNRSQAQPLELRTPILFTADSNAFPVPREGKARFGADVILGSLASEVTKGFDGILGQQPAAQRGKRMWDLVVRDDSRKLA